jgi:hypothetical protein
VEFQFGGIINLGVFFVGASLPQSKANVGQGGGVSQICFTSGWNSKEGISKGEPPNHEIFSTTRITMAPIMMMTTPRQQSFINGHHTIIDDTIINLTFNSVRTAPLSR